MAPLSNVNDKLENKRHALLEAKPVDAEMPGMIETLGKHFRQ